MEEIFNPFVIGVAIFAILGASPDLIIMLLNSIYGNNAGIKAENHVLSPLTAPDNTTLCVNNNNTNKSKGNIIFIILIIIKYIQSIRMLFN